MSIPIYYAKLKPEAKIPSKRDEDAGYDVYACFDEDFRVIRAHETVMIPTGIASAFPKDYAVILKERGSTGSKGIAQRCGVIDSGYRGEWQVPVTNTTNCDIAIVKESAVKNYPMFNSNRYVQCPYEKAITQALIIPVPQTESIEISLDELKTMTSERGANMLGSSGK